MPASAQKASNLRLMPSSILTLFQAGSRYPERGKKTESGLNPVFQRQAFDALKFANGH